jgi:alanyl-tRNA synthetase
MLTLEINQVFVGYFKTRGFSILPAAPLLHPSIPMSFVMSAGLVQVETALDQVGQRSGDKFVLLQNCFRHFDVDSIGTSDIHLSLFQMPGAFRFGPGGKSDTIRQMWRLVTEALGVAPQALWVTYFAGGQVFDRLLGEDAVTRRAWQEIGVPESRIVGLDSNSNYWKQGGGLEGSGVHRKCGPNTEIFFDRGAHLTCSESCGPGCRCGRFVEFANSLFIDTELDESGRLVPMREPFAETVIGTERAAMILQGKSSVFEIDSLEPIIQAIRQCYPPDRGKPASERIVADHLRALLFLVADGAPPPGKDGRQRIVKILIRNVLAHQMILGISSASFLPSVLAAITDLDSTHPNLKVARNTLLDYFDSESARFQRTVQIGQRRFNEFLKANGGHTLHGTQILSLEKRSGLPGTLTAKLLTERGLDFPKQEYDSLLQAWKASCRQSAQADALFQGGEAYAA